MAESGQKDSQDQDRFHKDDVRVPRIPPPAPPGRIPPPPAPPLRFPPAPPRTYPPPPPPSDIPYSPPEGSTSEESASRRTARKKSPQGKPQGARSKVKSSVPPPTPKYIPEKPRVSMNPAGRDSPLPKSQSQVSLDDSPKKGLIRTFFAKAKDYLLKKGYLPLEQNDPDVSTPEMPGMLKRYTPLEDDAYRITPPRDIQKDSGALSKLLTKGFTSSAEPTPEPESELESSAGNLGYVADPEDLKGNDHPLETSRSESDIVSDHGSESESEVCLEQSPIATALYAEGTIETAVARPMSACSSNAAEVNSELYRIKVSAPADIHVAYTVAGAVTTCITYETADGVRNAETRATK